MKKLLALAMALTLCLGLGRLRPAPPLRTPPMKTPLRLRHPAKRLP